MRKAQLKKREMFFEIQFFQKNKTVFPLKKKILNNPNK